MEEEKKNQRKAVILMIVGVITLIALVVGATYAYFSAQVGTGDKAQINAKAGTTDDLTFATTGPITITANQTNFAEGQDSLSDSATATAHLIAGDDDNTATEHYYLYLQIDANNLTYTVGKEQPELIMEITDPNKQPYTEPIEGLEYKTEITDGKGISYSGYDITEAKGLFAIAKNYEIIASNDKTDTWTIKVTFLNLSTDQHENTDKTLTGKLIIQKEEIVRIQDKLLADANKENTITLYHHNAEDLTDPNMANSDKIANDDSYRYAGEDYKIAENYKKNYTQINDELIKAECLGEDIGVYDECHDKWNYGALSPSKYYLDYKGKETLYDTYYDVLQQAIKDKYLEENVKNYVCLDNKTTGDCTSDEDLYRIIGLFKNNQDEYEMKLIRAQGATTTQLGDGDTATGGSYKQLYSSFSYYKGSNWETLAGYYWNNSSSSKSTNMWQYSNLNKINLNQFYYNYITTRAKNLQNHITEHTWITGGYSSNDMNAKMVYESELGANKIKLGDEVCYTQGDTSTTRKCTKEDIEYPAHIGLMYISDYMYGASPSSWITSASSYNNVTSYNWLYSGMTEWTISRDSLDYDYARFVDNTGSVYYTDMSVDSYWCGVRPSFYLTSDAKISEGEGSKTKPYRISFE